MTNAVKYEQIKPEDNKAEDSQPQKSSKDTQARKYLLTINNPFDKGYSQEKIRQILAQKFKSLIYYCMSEEIGGKDKTHHIHLFTMFSSPVRFSQITKYLPGAHVEMSRGTAINNKEYVFKESKWKDTEKGATNLRDTHYEWGEIPEERQGARADLAQLYELIESGASDYEIVSNNPDHILNLERIGKVREMIKYEANRKIFRNLFVTYISGKTAIGKTRYALEKYGYENVYQVTDYKHPFDSYKGEDVILFDEFRSSLPITQMLVYLDGYPTTLPCRYYNKQACFKFVYLIANEGIHTQYPEIQNEKPETWAAFLRRINKIYDFNNLLKTLGSMDKVYKHLDTEQEKFLSGQPPQDFEQIEMDTSDIFPD